jgi:hypothetical protein
MPPPVAEKEAEKWQPQESISTDAWTRQSVFVRQLQQIEVSECKFVLFILLLHIDEH